MERRKSADQPAIGIRCVEVISRLFVSNGRISVVSESDAGCAAAVGSAYIGCRDPLGQAAAGVTSPSNSVQ
jgi:hypothetical protein